MSDTKAGYQPDDYLRSGNPAEPGQIGLANGEIRQNFMPAGSLYKTHQ